MIHIESMSELQALLLSGFDDWGKLGKIRTKRQGDLILFNYVQTGRMEWNWMERVSRGLILNARDGEVEARPFDRFFNWGEGGRRASKGAHLVSAYEKMDGSLGILYRDYSGEGHYCRIATRGSFDGPQAQWATEWLNGSYLGDLDESLTLLFEIIYPQNRVVVDYGKFEGLVLLAARNRHTGEYLPHFPDVVDLAHKYNWATPTVYRFNSVADVLEKREQLDANHEGFVCEFSDGTRWKFKGDKYVEIHRLIGEMSTKHVAQVVKSGLVDDYLAAVPPQHRNAAEEMIEQVESTVYGIDQAVHHYYSLAPQGTRKEYALWVKEHCPQLLPYMFARLDGHDYWPIIYKQEFSVQ